MTELSQAEAVKLLMEDPVLRLETLMMIEDKNRNLVPMILFPIQRDGLETRTGRDVYVKPAQVGFSSLLMADYLLDCLTIRGTVSVIISYDEFITGRLLRKAQALYDNLQARVPSIPKMEHRSTFEKTFKGLGSSCYIGSARSFAFGRGETIHNLLIDEYGDWPSGAPEALFASALQRVPLTGNTKVAIVSTPNGEDNDFHEVYAAAREGHALGKSVFKAHFYPWYLHPEYSMTVSSSYVLPGDDKPVLDNFQPEELALMVRFELLGVDYEEANNKIRWRRYKIAEMASLRRSGATRLLFGQEFPEDDVSCFLVAGDMVYNTDRVNEMARECYPAPIHHLDADIWEPPEEGRKYLIAVDPGEGKISESVATVWNFQAEEVFQHCATLSGLYPQDVMGEKSMVLGRYYNEALLAVEDALDMVVHIKNYPQLYYRTDPVTGRVGKDIGWQTNTKTKPYMITEVNRHLSRISTHDIRIVSQFRNIRWVRSNSGQERAIPIGSDDYHDSTAIAVVCRESIPIERGFVGTAGWRSSWGR